jgi:hypothetical protein
MDTVGVAYAEEGMTDAVLILRGWAGVLEEMPCRLWNQLVEAGLVETPA